MDTATQPTVPAEAPAPAPPPPKRSAVEDVKERSRQLRGTVLQELELDSDHFSEADKNLLKFHGTYQQEDRDARKNRSKTGVGKHHMFMVRCKIPGGRLTADQYLAVDDLAGKHANGTLRFTTRQGIQLHGVLKKDLKETIAGINACLLTTLGACGDVERNVMACPAPHHQHGLHAQLQETAALLAAHLAPRTRAYHEIWLNGQPIRSQESGGRSQETGVRGQESGAASAPTPDPCLLTPDSCPLTPVEEPLYGKTYLPRKFKTGLALPEDNCIDVYAQDLGLLAVVENGAIAGYNVLVGGGMGMTHGNAHTFPHLAKPICYVPAQAVVGAAEAVVKLFRDHGNRADRKRARIKYLVHDWGVEKFRAVLSEYIGAPLAPPRSLEVSGHDTHLGWHPQGDGKWYYGLSIENGRVKDEGPLRLRTALRTLIERFRPELRLTPLQDVLLCNLAAEDRAEVEKVLAEHGVLRPDQISQVQKYSMACPAIPTCGLAISEAERALPAVIDQLEAELKRLGLEDEPLTVRMTGCPNGCARPYQSDIGLVGRSGDKYTVLVGGNRLGARLNFPLRDLVPHAQIVPLLVPLLELFKKARLGRESFGDFCQRLGVGTLQALLPEPTALPGRKQAEPPAPPPEKPEKAAKPAKPERPAVAGKREPRPPRPAPAPALPASRLPAPGPAYANGHAAHPHVNAVGPPVVTPALPQPQARAIPLALAQPEVKPAPVHSGCARMEEEVLLAGLPGEERRDAAFRYNSDGSVRVTVVYFYGADARAAQAQPGDALSREAVYLGKVDPTRLHAARKLSDTYYVGPRGHELRDLSVEYHPDGSPARTVIYHYEGNARAAEAPSGAAVRRQVTYSSGKDEG
jgi:sulfite reductase (ferredoxin)